MTGRHFVVAAVAAIVELSFNRSSTEAMLRVAFFRKGNRGYSTSSVALSNVTRALVGNAIVTSAKLGAAFITVCVVLFVCLVHDDKKKGSPAIFSEAIHTLIDTANQGLLLRGVKVAKRAPDERHNFGYGRGAFFCTWEGGIHFTLLDYSMGGMNVRFAHVGMFVVICWGWSDGMAWHINHGTSTRGGCCTLWMDWMECNGTEFYR